MYNFLITLLLLINSLSIFAANYKYQTMKQIPGYEAKFILGTSQANKTYGILDCQSFIQKIDIYKTTGEKISDAPITYAECEGLYKKYTRCIEDKGSICINTQNIFSNSCYCK